MGYPWRRGAQRGLKHYELSPKPCGYRTLLSHDYLQAWSFQHHTGKDIYLETLQPQRTHLEQL
jgi:hypothetical protein